MSLRVFLIAFVLTGVMAEKGTADNTKPADLARARAEAARETYEGILLRRTQQPAESPLEAVYQWSRRWMEAEQSLAPDKAGKAAALRGHLERMRKLETTTAEHRKGGFAAAFEVSQTRFYRIEAELWLVEMGTK